MNFPAKIYAAALLASWLTSCLALPLLRNWCRQTGLVDDPGHRKIHREPVPLAGGLAVLAGLLLPVLLGVIALSTNVFGAQATPLLEHGLGKRALTLGVILAGCAGMTFLGWLDDKHELRPGLKLLGQFAIAAATAAAGVRITLFVDNPFFSYGLTIVWILTVTTAINILDNMNGLCAGVGLIAAGWFAWFAVAQEQYLVALLALCVVGALLGFLPYNYPRASVFLGDAGSHLVGYLLAMLAILPHFYSRAHPTHWAVLCPLAVLAVPLFDLVCVIWIRLRAGKPIYVGDNNHLSHRLVRAGHSPAKAVALIWLATALSGALILFAR